MPNERVCLRTTDGRTDGVNDGRKERANGRGSLRPRPLPPVFFSRKNFLLPFSPKK